MPCFPYRKGEATAPRPTRPRPIPARKPEGGIDPEADLVANNDFWGNFAAALRMPFQMRVGDEPGNPLHRTESRLSLRTSSS
jgi:hypothetical protein